MFGLWLAETFVRRRVKQDLRNEGAKHGMLSIAKLINVIAPAGISPRRRNPEEAP